MDNEQLSVPLLYARQLSKSYVRGRWNSSGRRRVIALEHIDLTIWPRSTLALTGRSGAGKSTLARCLVRLEEPDSGEVWFRGTDLLRLRSSELKRVRRDIQLVFQQSATSMNPRLTAEELVAEPLRIQGQLTRRAQREQALAMMEQVGIPRQWSNRTPLEFSGGQRQRLALARALTLKPALLILDEALAGLDLSTQAQIANLLLQLQASLSLSYLFITHDLKMAAHFAGTIAVMQDGAIVESGKVRDLFSNPRHAATRELVESIPGAAALPQTGLDTVR